MSTYYVDIPNLFKNDIIIQMINLIRTYSLYIAWLIVLSGVGGSLYASSVLNIEPCVLCWYQRIFLYPLAFIIPIGILRKDTSVYLYALPLSLAGVIVALYHYLLYIKIIPETLAPCSTNAVSCTQELPKLFGLVDILQLSLIAFILITILLLSKKIYGTK